MRARPRSILLAAQWIAAALIFFYVGRQLVAQWDTLRATPLAANPRWWAIALATAVVLGAYALLVQTWRVLLAEAGETLSFREAARIWSISNLWRYVPGKVWSIGVMTEMARRANVGGVAAAGSSVLNVILNVAAGLAIVLVLGWRWLDLIGPNARIVAIGLVAIAAAGLLSLPFVLARVAAFTARVMGRDVQVAAPKPRTLIVAAAGNAAAWLAYGLAFKVFVVGVLGVAPGAAWQYVAVYTASYLVGYLILFLPGGIGAREGVMFALLPALHLTTDKQALLLAAASRLWLTVLEILPGVLFMVVAVLRRRSTASNPSTDVSNE